MAKQDGVTQKQDIKMYKGFLQETNYLNSHLNEGEFPLYRAHLSWIPIFTRQIPFMLIGGIAGGIVWGVLDNFIIGLTVMLCIYLLGVLSQIRQIYKNVATDILLTNQGIHSKYKLFAIEDDQFTRYAYVNDAELTYNSIVQRMLEFGDIEISTISGAGNDYAFKNIAKPMSLKRAIRAAQNKYGSVGGNVFNNMGPMGNQNQQDNGGQGNGRRRRGGHRRRGK